MLPSSSQIGEFGTGVSLAQAVDPAIELAKARRIVRRTSFTLRQMLFDQILPLWSTLGADHRGGGYTEALSPYGTRVVRPRQAWVTARQVYAFCDAARLGWNKAAAAACVRHGYQFLQSHTSADGFLRHSFNEDGYPSEDHIDLYDQAFLLLAYARAYELLEDPDIERRAQRLYDSIASRFSHPSHGFFEQSYPHRYSDLQMHMLDAALAWIQVSPAPVWHDLADLLVSLFRERLLIEPLHCVPAEFHSDWSVVQHDGKIRIIPEHNFEWAWLILQWAHLTNRSAGDEPERIIQNIEQLGYDPSRRVAVNEIWSDGTVSDRTARLTAQAARLRAWLAIAERNFGRVGWEAEQLAIDAAASLRKFFKDRPGGMWAENMCDDGQLEDGDVLASSLQQIIRSMRLFICYAHDNEKAFLLQSDRS